MPVINKLIQKIRTCGLQNPPTRSVPGRGYFLCIYHSGLHCLVIPHRDAVSGHTALDAVSRNTGKIVSIGNTCNSFQRLPFSGPRIGVRDDLLCHTALRRVERSFRT